MPIAALRLLPTWARLYRPPRLLSLYKRPVCVCVYVVYTRKKREEKTTKEDEASFKWRTPGVGGREEYVPL